MARFYRVQIDDIYLTSTGDEDGIPCKLEVTSVEDLERTWFKTSYQVSDGSFKEQWFEWVDGKKFEIRIQVLPTEIYEELKALEETCANLSKVDQEDVNARFIVKIVKEGETPKTISVSAKWDDEPYDRESFWNDRSNNVVLRFITKGEVPEEEED